MHRIFDDGVEKKVSFDTWQRQTNIHYEDDRKSTGSTTDSASILKGRSKSDPQKSSVKSQTSRSYKVVKVVTGPSQDTKDALSTIISAGTRISGGVGGSTSKRRTKTSLNIDPRRFVIGASAKREIIGGSHYSRALLIDAHLLTKGPAPDNLRYLETADHLFFKHCKKFPPEIKDFNPKHKRGIWNAGGRCVYYVGQTSYYLFKNFRSGFTYEVVDYLGEPVLTSKGSQWNLGFKGEVSVYLGNGILLGTMEQETFSSSYNIKDSQGRIVYTIQAPCYAPVVPFIVWCFQEEFEICMDDGISQIGTITRGWDDEFPDFGDDLGLEFETTDDNRVKALLLGVYFLLEFQYYKHGGNGVAYFILMTCGISALSFVLSNGFGFFPQINSPLVPKEVIES